MTNRKSYGIVEPPDTVCVIEWLDASGQEGPVSRNELSELKRLVSVGWLVRETEELITIAQDYHPGQDTFREALNIPKLNVVSRNEYKHVRR